VKKKKSKKAAGGFKSRFIEVPTLRGSIIDIAFVQCQQEEEGVKIHYVAMPRNIPANRLERPNPDMVRIPNLPGASYQAVVVIHDGKGKKFNTFFMQPDKGGIKIGSDFPKLAVSQPNAEVDRLLMLSELTGFPWIAGEAPVVQRAALDAGYLDAYDQLLNAELNFLKMYYFSTRKGLDGGFVKVLEDAVMNMITEAHDANVEHNIQQISDLGTIQRHTGFTSEAFTFASTSDAMEAVIQKETLGKTQELIKKFQEPKPSLAEALD
jgi:hypothetical protein